MTVEKLIKQLQKFNPKAVVKLHHMDGDIAMFAVGYLSDDSTIVIEGRDDNNLGVQLEARFENIDKIADTELGFYKDLLDTGFTLDDIKKYYPEMYTKSEAFMLEHGLITMEDVCNG